jgi:hypothetical protein
LTTDTFGDHWDARPSPDEKSIVYILRRFDDLNRLDVVLLEIETGKSFTLSRLSIWLHANIEFSEGFHDRNF